MKHRSLFFKGISPCPFPESQTNDSFKPLTKIRIYVIIFLQTELYLIYIKKTEKIVLNISQSVQFQSPPVSPALLSSMGYLKFSELYWDRVVALPCSHTFPILKPLCTAICISQKRSEPPRLCGRNINGNVNYWILWRDEIRSCLISSIGNVWFVCFWECFPLLPSNYSH